MSTLLLMMFASLFTLPLHFTVAQIGVAYGRNGDNLPPPSRVVELYKQYGIQRMRIYEPYEDTLTALRGSDIELTMSILNPELPNIAASQANADAWVEKYIKAYTPGVAFRNIVIGNEISPSSENSKHVLQVMANIDAAISSAGLGGQIKVTTSIASDMVVGYPPEVGRFRGDVVDYFRPIISFIAAKGGPLMASIYPGISYRSTPGMDIRYALLDPTYPGNPTEYGHNYQNLFFALVDTVRAATDDIVRTSPDADQIRSVDVGGGESNWGGGGPTGFSVDADPGETATYVNNLINLVKSGRGTPLKPDRPILTFVFTMFDENLKPGPEDERHFGIFNLDGTPKYNFNFK